MPDCEISVVNVATNVRNSATGTASGTYRVPSVPPGIYKVTAKKAGFKQALAENIRVAVGATVDVDSVLEVGKSTETVTVRAEAPLLEATPQLGTDISPAEFETWPVL